MLHPSNSMHIKNVCIIQWIPFIVLGSIHLVNDWAEFNFSLIKRTNSKSRRLIRLYVSLLMNGETVGLWHKRIRLPMYSIGAII